MYRWGWWFERWVRKGRSLNEVENWIKAGMRPVMGWRFFSSYRSFEDESRPLNDAFWPFSSFLSFKHLIWTTLTLRLTRFLVPKIFSTHSDSWLYLLNSLIHQPLLLLMNRTFRNQHLFKTALWKEKQNQLDIHHRSFEFIPLFRIFYRDCPTGHPIRGWWFSAQVLAWRTKRRAGCPAGCLADPNWRRALLGVSPPTSLHHLSLLRLKGVVTRNLQG